MAELVTCSIDPVCSLSQSVICFVQPVRNSIMFTYSPSHLLIWSYLLAHSVSCLLTHLLNHTWWYTLVDDWIICSLNSVACSLSCSIAPPSDRLIQSPEETGTKKAFFGLISMYKQANILKNTVSHYIFRIWWNFGTNNLIINCSLSPLRYCREGVTSWPKEIKKEMFTVKKTQKCAGTRNILSDHSWMRYTPKPKFTLFGLQYMIDIYY